MLMRSFGLDALAQRLQRDNATAAVDGEFTALLNQFLTAATPCRPMVWPGEDLRIEAEEMVASALVPDVRACARKVRWRACHRLRGSLIARP
jgi:hypothetical protein